MNNISLKACVLSVILAATTVQAEDALTFENYLPASSVSMERFTCVDSEADQVRVDYESRLMPSGGRKSKVTALAAGKVVASADILGEINRAADGANISGVSVACASTGIRVMVEIYRPGSAPPDSDCMCDNNAFLFVYLHKGAASFTME